MKITFILPGIGVAGGIRSTFEIANRLQERGHKVSVVYPLIPIKSGVKWYNIKNLAGRALGLAANLRQGNHIRWFDLKAKLIRVPTLAGRYIPKGDVIVATWWANAYDVNSYRADKGKKFYFIRHYETWGGPEDLVNETYTLPLHKIVTSTWLKTLIEGKFNVSVFGPIPNGVNFNLFYKSGSDFRCHNPRRVGMVYRRAKWKAMEDGFRAFQIAKRKYPDIQLVLFGERRGKGVPEDAELHKFPSSDKLRELYNSLDIFIFPSHYEGFGNPPMEAMACGAACISTCVGAVPDYIIDGKTGLLCPPHAPDKLAELLIYPLENEETRKQIAKAGHKHIQRFTWDRSVDQLEEIFSKANLEDLKP
jgi:L-malate glycosyltransferase